MSAPALATPPVERPPVERPEPDSQTPADRLDLLTPGQVDARQGQLLDAVVAGYAVIAAAQAQFAEQVDELLRWSHDAAEAAAVRAGKERADGLDHRFAEHSVTVELACALRMPERSATALLVESQSLIQDHPATMTALSEGAVSYRHAVTVLDATVGLDEESTAQMDVLLAHRAQTTTVSGLKRVARRERERRDSRPLLTRHRVAAQDRHVELHPCGDGMAWLHHLLPAVQATAIFNRLSDIAAAVQSPDDPRTLAQLRADASVDLLLDDDARAALAAATHARTVAHHTDDAPVPSIAGIADKVSLGGIKPQVAVTVPVMTLLGLSDEPGDLAGHGPIDADTARRLAAQAPSFLRILTHPETGTVLSVGRDRYAVPADLKSWLRIRDETCRFPGCARRAPRCDIDHITDWAHGGTTDHHNLIHLCRHHHRLKHTTRWTVSTVPPDNPNEKATHTGTPQNTDLPTTPSADVVHWTAPSGRTYIDRATVDLTHRQTERDDALRTKTADLDRSTFPDEPPF